MGINEKNMCKIDMEKAIKAFNEYVNNYNKNDLRVILKHNHTFGTVKFSEYIAKDLKLSEEDIELAKLIGLLHDIGRFEQLRVYNSFDDYTTIDHADNSVNFLFNENKIRNFIQTNEFDSIIMKAIKNHNKYEIENGLSERELLHAKIIRDSDKTDNFRVKETQSFKALFNSTEEAVSGEKISEDVYNCFMNAQIIVSSSRKTNMDKWVSYIAFIFDYNFSSGLKYLKENNYINKLVDRLDYKNEDTIIKMKAIKEFANSFIAAKLT